MNDYRPTAFSRELCARLRGLIARYDLNQVDLASLCDVSQSQFSKIIRGVRPITVDQVAVLCDALDVSVVDLIQDVEKYVAERDLHASPVLLVDDHDRLTVPVFWDPARVKLDDWAQDAHGRFGAIDFDLAASDDEHWQSRQEGEHA